LLRDNHLETLEELHVEPHMKQHAHLPARVSPKFHAGTRGNTGQDEAQREWTAATERLSRRVARQIGSRATGGLWVVLAGRADVVHQIQAALPKPVQHRTAIAASINLLSPRHELELVAREASLALRAAEDEHALQQLADSGDEHRGAALGENATRRALDNAAVARLYLSPRFMAENAMRVEAALRSALEQGADIEAVSGDAGSALDSMGGIAAKLRYSTP
jgi:stalled ribosome rescue protein Dom34